MGWMDADGLGVGGRSRRMKLKVGHATTRSAVVAAAAFASAVIAAAEGRKPVLPDGTIWFLPFLGLRQG